MLDADMEIHNCQFCGRPLKKYTLAWWSNDENPAPVVGAHCPHTLRTITEIISVKPGKWRSHKLYWTGLWGYNGNGYFCSLRCGYGWAVTEMDKRAAAELDSTTTHTADSSTGS